MIFNTVTGPVQLTTIFEFIPKVRRKILPESSVRVSVLDEKFFESNKYRYGTLDHTSMRTLHFDLSSDPENLISSVKSSLSTKYFYGDWPIQELLHKLCNEAACYGVGQPDHFFPIGKNLFCLAQVNDWERVINKEFQETMYCVKPNRNFLIEFTEGHLTLEDLI